MSNRARLRPKRKINLMVDSGAFSAWQSGREIDIDAYIRWLKRNERWLYSYVNLDVMPYGGEAEAFEKSASASDYNLQKMLDAGLRPIPVLHEGEDEKWLVKMVEDKHEVIGIGSQHTSTLAARRAYLNKVFTLLCDKQGRPCVKTHGFAMGAGDLVFNYPFHTVDSTTWILGGAAFGRIVTPHGSGDLGRDADLYVGNVTRSPQHINLLGPLQLEAMTKHFDAVGVTRDDVRASYISRARTMALTNRQRIEARRVTPCRFSRKTAWAFSGDMPRMPRMEPLEPFALKIFNVAWGNVMNHVLNEVGWPDRLMSYLNISEWDGEDLANYVGTGFPREYQYKGKN